MMLQPGLCVGLYLLSANIQKNIFPTLCSSVFLREIVHFDKKSYQNENKRGMTTPLKCLHIKSTNIIVKNYFLLRSTT